MFTKIGKSKFMKFVLYITTFAFVGTGLVAIILYKLSGGISGIAEVNGVSITPAEVMFRVNQIKINLSNQGVNVENKKIHNQIVMQALNQAIDDELLYQEAEKEEIAATKEEVKKWILNAEIFQKDGKFSKDLYLTFLSQFNISPQLFETLLRKNLSAQHLFTIYQVGSYITDEELKYLLLKRQLTFSGKFIVINPPKFEIKEEELRKFYKEHQDKFAAKEGKKLLIYKIDFTRVGQDKAQKLAKVVFSKLKNGERVNEPNVENVFDGVLLEDKNIVGLPKEVIDGIKELNDDKNTAFIKTKNAYYIGKYLGKGYVASPYEKVKELIKSEVQYEKSRDWIDNEYSKLEKVVKEKKLEDIAKDLNLQIENIQNLEFSQFAVKYGLNQKNVDYIIKNRTGVLKLRNKILIFKIEKLVLNKDKKQYIQVLKPPMLAVKQQVLREMYLEKLRKNADIKINKRLLDSLR